MQGVLAWLAVGAGGALGAMARFGVTRLSASLIGTGFPLGTMAVNIAGSFLMGVLVYWLSLRDASAPFWRLFVATGVLGGFTTFSAFSLDAVNLWRDGAVMLSIGYVLGSVLLGVLGLIGGLWLGRAIL